MAKILVIDDEPSIRDLLDTSSGGRAMPLYLLRVVGRVWSAFAENAPMS